MFNVMLGSSNLKATWPRESYVQKAWSHYVYVKDPPLDQRRGLIESIRKTIACECPCSFQCKQRLYGTPDVILQFVTSIMKIRHCL